MQNNIHRPRGNILRIKFAPGIKAFDVDLSGDGYGSEFWEDLGKGHYESDTVSVIQRYSDTGRLFVDLGAACGAFTLIAASLGFRVLSLEANRDVFANLSRNVDLNSHIKDQVTVVNGIIVPIKKFEDQSEKTPAGILTEIVFSGVSDQAFANVPMVTLKNIIEPLGKNKLFVKIDIEGAEWALFRCSEFMNTLKENSAVLLVALHPGLNRPWRERSREMYAFKEIRKLIWWIRNVLDLKEFFVAVDDYQIYRTNGGAVNKLSKLIALVFGGYHEFLLVPKK